jgi:CheY-like chemotaxis protein
VASSSSTPNIDAAIADNFDGDAALYWAFAAACAAQFEHDAVTGQRAIERGDLSQLGRLTHDLKSALTLLGHGDLGCLASEVEAQAQRGERALASEAWHRLRAALTTLSREAPPSAEIVADARAARALDVLFVEDYEPSAALVRHSLAQREPTIRLDVVPTVAEAIERLQRFEQGSAQLPRYDAVLTDLHLPDGLGLDILAHVRRRRLRLAVLILTAADERDTNQHALRSGADAYVAKRDDYLARLPQTLHAAVQRLPGTEHIP